MVDQREAFLTATRQAELVLNPVRGQFDVAHLQEVHRRIFQDLPHHGPGEFRPDAPGHFKHRLLEASRERTVVPYALRSDADRMLGPTLDALQGGKALAGFDLLEMSEAIAQTYARLDYLHPFREANSRTLRTFTEQLARENGHRLDWGTTNVTPEPYDRRMTIAETVREVAAVGPVAFNQAEREVAASHLAVLRHQMPVADHERAVDQRDWVAQHGTMAMLSERLEQVESGHITIRHEPGASALDRLRAVADGIGRELDRQHIVAPPSRVIEDGGIEREVAAGGMSGSAPSSSLVQAGRLRFRSGRRSGDPPALHFSFARSCSSSRSSMMPKTSPFGRRCRYAYSSKRSRSPSRSRRL